MSMLDLHPCPTVLAFGRMLDPAFACEEKDFAGVKHLLKKTKCPWDMSISRWALHYWRCGGYHTGYVYIVGDAEDIT